MPKEHRVVEIPPFEIDGNTDNVSFLYLTDGESLLALAGSIGSAPAHKQIVDFGIMSEDIPPELIVEGGGVIIRGADSRWEYQRQSHDFGSVADDISNYVIQYLLNKCP